MSLQFDSCGRYKPRSNDEIYWRFKGDNGKKPFRKGTVTTVRQDGLFGVGEKLAAGVINARSVVYLDVAEIQVR